MNVNLAYSPELHDDELVSRQAGPGGGRHDPVLPAGSHDVGRAERSSRQRHPDHRPVLGDAPNLQGHLRAGL
jgi:hypothetical protein